MEKSKKKKIYKKIDAVSFYKSIVDQDRASVVICNLKHEIIYMNPAVGRVDLFGPWRLDFVAHGFPLGKGAQHAQRCHGCQNCFFHY